MCRWGRTPPLHSRRWQRDLAETIGTAPRAFHSSRSYHFAIEIPFEQGFFGLIASGWDIEDTTGKGARGPLPDEAGEVESVAGLFDSERGSGTLWTADEFALFASRKLTRTLDEAAIRAFDRAGRTCTGDGPLLRLAANWNSNTRVTSRRLNDFGDR